MNAGRELLAYATILRLLACRLDGHARFLLEALAALAWLQAAQVLALVGIRLTATSVEVV